MDSTIIQKYTTSIISGLSQKIDSLSKMSHNLTKGELRELFISDVLNLFLADQYGVGSGIIINQAGLQSNQTDIIIYDKRLIPPFIQHQSIGVFPVESVLGVIEVKTNLTNEAIRKTEEDFKFLREEICSSQYSIYPDIKLEPICGLIGFYGIGKKELRTSAGSVWLKKNIKHLMAICLVRKFSWLRTPGWSISLHDPSTFEETKRIVAVLIDNIRTKSSRTPYLLDGEHKDWLSIYLRDQPEIKRIFDIRLSSDS